MLKENQKITITWNPQQANYFRKLGYNFNKGDIIEVSPEELQYSSHKRVYVYCDNCGKELGMEYRQYTHKREKFNGNYYCDACASGAIETKIKRKNTCLEKYGKENPMQVEEIVQKLNESLCKNGQVPTSSQQLKIYEMLQKHYPNCQINYPVNYFSLDCFIDTGKVWIDIEYDGWYWHQDFQKDIKRDKILQNKGYKVLRIKGGNMIPKEEDLINKVKYLEEEEVLYTEIILNDYKFKKEKEIVN